MSCFQAFYFMVGSTLAFNLLVLQSALFILHSVLKFLDNAVSISPQFNLHISVQKLQTTNELSSSRQYFCLLVFLKELVKTLGTLGFPHFILKMYFRDSGNCITFGHCCRAEFSLLQPCLRLGALMNLFGNSGRNWQRTRFWPLLLLICGAVI